MSEESTGNPAENPFAAMGEMFGGAIAAQRRSVNMAQDWAESVVETYKSQAEGYQALTEAMRSSMTALERTLKSQEETNRALRESLEAYKKVVESASETQDRNSRLVQNFFDDVVKTLQGQLESSRALLAEPAQRQQEFFQNITQEWMEAYTRLLSAPFDAYRAGAGGGAEGEEKS